MQLREIAHHSNAPADGEFSHSRNFHCNPICNWAVFPYGQDYHLTHHVFGLMPHYNLAKAHEILMRYPPYREQAVACYGYFFPRLGRKGRVRSRQCQGFPRNPGRFHPGSGLSPSLDQLGAIEREASFL